VIITFQQHKQPNKQLFFAMKLLKQKPRTADKETQTIAKEQCFITNEIKQIAKMPVFGGKKDESFKEFCQLIETTHSSNANKMKILIMRLHGKATNEFNKIMKNNPEINFPQMINELQKAFPEQQLLSLQMLRNRKQQINESLESFAEAIKSLVNRFFTNARGYNEQSRNYQMIKFFSSNVQQPLKVHLKRINKNCRTLNDILMKAKQLQNKTHKQQIPKITSEISHLHISEQHAKNTRNKSKSHQEAKRDLSNQGSEQWNENSAWINNDTCTLEEKSF
jgi:hypothetical protein